MLTFTAGHGLQRHFQERKRYVALQNTSPTHNHILTADSVDLLLQLMRSADLIHETDPPQELTDSDHPDPVSPTKPLMFHSQIPKERQNDNKEKYHDSNSSSDTYVSDTNAADHSAMQGSHQASFERNFEASGDLSMLWELKPVPDESLPIEPVDRDIPLPSKSIMKSASTPGNSPKKSVAFQPGQQLETLHQYTPATEHETSSPVNESEIPLGHLWAEMDKDDHITDSASASPPPVPPPHTSNTITGLLSPNDDLEAVNDDVDISALSEYRLSHKNYSNLSLSEKLDIFLSDNARSPHDDLDQHLDRLDQAKKEETDVNIHHLSFQLEEQHDHVENPLDVLYKTQEVHLRSAGSSQLSLQSLMDSNRYLQSNNIATLSSGIQFNDGIKGFSDYVAEQIVPSTDTPNNDHDSSAEMLTFGTSLPQKQESESDDEEFQDSFNHSYNLTEKSIMNLLNSASQINLPTGDVEQSSEKVSSEDLKAEGHSDGIEERKLSDTPPAQDTQTIKVKVETLDNTVKSEPERSFVKRESDSESLDLPAYDEPSEVNLKQEPETSMTIKEQDLSRAKQMQNDRDFETPIVKTGLPESPEAMIEQEQPQIKSEPSESVRPSESVLPAELIKSEELKQPVTTVQIPLKSINDSFTDEIVGNTSIHCDEAEMAYKPPASAKLIDSSQSTLPKVETPVKSEDLEFSNDGDIEEDDTEDVSHVKLETVHHLVDQAKEEPSDQSSNQSEVFQDTSEELVGKTLAPPKTLDSSKAEISQEPVRHIPVHKNLDENDNSILANSSNIFPTSNTAGTAPSFTSNLDPGLSFEDSLSAEHDKDKKSLDFISIWHSQLQKRGSELPREQLSYNVPSIQNYNTAELSQYNTYSIPASLQPKRFKEFNIVSKRIVSPGFEDLQVSGFLPELSQDSGWDSNFKGLINTQSIQHDLSTNSTSQKLVGRSKSLNTQDVLSHIDDSNVDEPPAPAPLHKKRYSIHNSLRPVSVAVNNVPIPQATVKRSKFHVPSFEIKRSNSILSPKNLYNEIFEDLALGRPTIKATGMKTLPSMDREDVKRILQMKQAMSQEEYSNLKLVGPRQQSVVQELADNYDQLQQLASIHCDSLMSTAPASLQKRRDRLSHVIGELSSVPVAIDSKDEIMNDFNIFELKNEDAATNTEEPPTRSPLRLRKQENLAFPEPDSDLISVSEVGPGTEATRDAIGSEAPFNAASNPFVLATLKNPFAEDLPVQDASVQKPSGDAAPREPLSQIEPTQVAPAQASPVQFSPSKIQLMTVKRVPQTPPPQKLPVRTSPIKINASPVKLVKNGTEITGVVLEKKHPTLEADFQGDELSNRKRRSQKSQSQILEHGSHGNHLSFTTATEASIALNTEADTQEGVVSTLQSSVPQSIETDRGKLFLRVVGLKNIELPDIKSRKGAFSITLDNGVHCIKTPNYTLDSLDVLIGKEFELTVGKSLEFILTMKATYDKPKGTLVEVQERKVVKSRNKIGRLFGSKDIVTTTKYVPQDVKDPWRSKFAADGSFARCYVDLEQYEEQISGVARNFNITCFNEWEVSTRGGQVVQREPYKIAQLEVRMLYVPRTEAYEVLPTSIKLAYESLDELRSESHLALEGYLHQEGGDCDIWKKRWFKLSGTSLIAHSEYSHKTRAKINLAKVVEVIYVDKENAQRSSSNYRNFSDILLMENAFKIRFANGEVIDFGAPNKDEKVQWIKTIQEIVYRNKFRRQPWVKLMQERNGNSRPRSIVAPL